MFQIRGSGMVLMAIDGRKYLSMISKELNITHSYACLVKDKLIEIRLIKIVKGTDNRSKVLQLTAKGRKVRDNLLVVSRLVL